jgi:GNAT superfamily N-acetyltransferase
MELEIVDGSAGWRRSDVLDRACYPPEAMARLVWRDVIWAEADRRIFVTVDGLTVCHAGIYLRVASCCGTPVRVAGIGSVMTAPGFRGRGCASVAMRSAAEHVMRENCDFGMLFCEPRHVGFYARLGWHVFGGDVFCLQPDGAVKLDMMQTMILPLRMSPAEGMLDLCGLPW